MNQPALNWLRDSLDHLRDRQLYRQLTTRGGPQSATISLNGATYVNFASNDYLGLANDPRLANAAKQAIHTSGWGGGASPLIVGHSREHANLEESLAAFEGTEAALLFPTGFAANAGIIPAMVGPGDTVFSDAKNHASIIDGCRLSRAKIEVYPHADVEALKRMLDRCPLKARKLIVTDGLFSMDGDIAPLPEIASVADQFGAMLMVDEAHATGVLGQRGRGACEACGIEDRVDIKVGTLSKALGTMGGFMSGSRELVDWIINRARSYVFSTACPAASCAAGLAALEIVRDEPRRRTELQATAEILRGQLIELGWNTGSSTTQIIPIIVGEPEETMSLTKHLKERGFLVPGIRPPSVPSGQSLLRLSICWDQTEPMRAKLLEALQAIRSQA